MKIRLFRAFPDSYRKSMQIWADQLLKNIPPLLNEDEEMCGCLPSAVRLSGRLSRYWDQYVRYQRFSLSAAGDVNHVIDHGYGHLVASLPHHRTIVTFHDAIVTKTKPVNYRTRLSFRYSLRSIRKAAMVLAASKTSRHDFLADVDYPEDRVRVVYPGVDSSFQMAADRDALKKQLGLKGIAILHVGHNQPYMNVEGVFRACERLSRKHGFDVHLIKVGEPFTQAQEVLIDRLALRARLTHLGRLPFHKLPDIYNCADVFMYPAHYAGFGISPLEAMACGTPVICSNRGALPEVLGEAAILTDPTDHDGIADRTAALLTDAKLRETQQLSGLRQASQYSWHKTARDVLAAYREIATT